MVKIRFVLRSGEKEESWVRSLPDTPPPAEKCISRTKRPDNKRQLLGVRKTIVHASHKLPPSGCYHDFKLDRTENQKRETLAGLPLPETTLKTLFLDLDETLIYHKKLDDETPDQYDFTTDEYYIIKRPNVEWLLQLAVDCGYEIVIFTAGSRAYASQIIDKIDPMGLIKHRLYRDSCKRDAQGKCIKDLAATGRNLARCIIFDDKIEKVLPRENAVRVMPFEGDKQDNELMRFILFFVIESIRDDLRTVAKMINKLLESKLKSVTGS